MGAAVLAPASSAERIATLLVSAAPAIRVESASDVAGLCAIAKSVTESSDWLLISFGTSVIVPRDVLVRFGAGAVNFHAAPPEYPGRDPHHFAIYDGARVYGATVHVMTPQVDAGPILAVRRFTVGERVGAKDLLQRANDACWTLMEEIVPKLVRRQSLEPVGLRWAPRKNTRRDFLQLCQVPWFASAEEVDRRVRATQFGDRSNAYVEIHGHRFRHECAVPVDGGVDAEQWADFTESSYSDLLDLAATKYRFAGFEDQGSDRHVLWRHDVDFSVHRAVRLAEIEHRKNLKATYFFMFSSPFYNLLEHEVLARARHIVSLGHGVGLHFDAQPQATADAMEQQLLRERRLLGDVLDVDIRVVSFHNPTVVNAEILHEAEVAGMVNAYGAALMERYAYCSDSNGYWRHQPLRNILTLQIPERLQVLTHPEWWTERAMAPRRRIERAIAGRGAAVMVGYDTLLAAHGRKNIT